MPEIGVFADGSIEEEDLWVKDGEFMIYEINVIF